MNNHDDHDDRDEVPRYLDSDENWRVPIAWRIYEDRETRIQMLTKIQFAEAHHRGRGGR